MFTSLFDDHITVQEAARLLEVSRPTIYRMIRDGRLRYEAHPVTGRKRLSRVEVVSLLGAGQLPPPAQPLMGDRVAEAAPAGYHVPVAAGEIVDSIFRLPELRLDFGVDDLSERVDYYRFRGLPGEKAGVPGHIWARGDEREHGSPLPPGGD